MHIDVIDAKKTAMIVVDMQNDFVFLSDATATYDYPDRGFGAMANGDVHHATLVILAASTAHVMSVKDMRSRILSGDRTMVGAGVR